MRTPWLALACTALCSAAGAQDAAAPTQPSTKPSAARFASLGPLAFGPSGVLFAADVYKRQRGRTLPARRAGLSRALVSLEDEFS